MDLPPPVRVLIFVIPLVILFELAVSEDDDSRLMIHSLFYHMEFEVEADLAGDNVCHFVEKTRSQGFERGSFQQLWIDAGEHHTVPYCPISAGEPCFPEVGGHNLVELKYFNMLEIYKYKREEMAIPTPRRMDRFESKVDPYISLFADDDVSPAFKARKDKYILKIRSVDCKSGVCDGKTGKCAPGSQVGLVFNRDEVLVELAGLLKDYKEHESVKKGNKNSAQSIQTKHPFLLAVLGAGVPAFVMACFL